MGIIILWLGVRVPLSPSFQNKVTQLVRVVVFKTTSQGFESLPCCRWIFNTFKKYMELNLLSIVFISLRLIRAIGVLIAPSAVHSVLCLVLSFINVCGLLFIVEAEILALLFLVVYIGAIAILFLFVVMMLDLKTVSFQQKDLYSLN